MRESAPSVNWIDCSCRCGYATSSPGACRSGFDELLLGALLFLFRTCLPCRLIRCRMTATGTQAEEEVTDGPAIDTQPVLPRLRQQRLCLQEPQKDRGKRGPGSSCRNE